MVVIFDFAQIKGN
jgi:hypothetical protein